MLTQLTRFSHNVSTLALKSFFSTQSFVLHLVIHRRAIPTKVVQGKMTPQSKRTGVVALKIGMMPIWDKWNTRIPCTVLQVVCFLVCI